MIHRSPGVHELIIDRKSGKSHCTCGRSSSLNILEHLWLLKSHHIFTNRFGSENWLCRSKFWPKNWSDLWLIMFKERIQDSEKKWKCPQNPTASYFIATSPQKHESKNWCQDASNICIKNGLLNGKNQTYTSFITTSGTVAQKTQQTPTNHTKNDTKKRLAPLFKPKTEAPGQHRQLLQLPEPSLARRRIQ